jgi:hypothetical protein
MTHFISGCQGAAGITKMKVMKATELERFDLGTSDVNGYEGNISKM